METMIVMKTTSWGITHNIVDDTLLVSIFGMLDPIICKTYLATLLQKTRHISSFIFQMSSGYVPAKNDLSELIATVRQMTAIRSIAIILANSAKTDIIEMSPDHSIFADSDVKICFDEASAINWSSQRRITASA
jgi:hypothetical protein